MMGDSIEEVLTESRTAITNALGNVPIKTALATFGYDEAKLQAGNALLTTAQNLYTKQADEYGDKAGASQAAQQAREALADFYVPHVKVARIAFKGNAGAYRALDLSGRRRKAHADSLAQARTFYSNASGDDDYKAALAAFGITEEKLTEGLALVEAAANALDKYKKEAGEAQEATEKRDKALDALEEWMGDFIAIARIALADTPQKLEILGIVVKRD